MKRRRYLAPVESLLSDRERKERNQWLDWTRRNVVKPSEFYSGLFARKLASIGIKALERAPWSYAANGERSRVTRTRSNMGVNGAAASRLASSAARLFYH